MDRQVTNTCDTCRRVKDLEAKLREAEALAENEWAVAHLEQAKRITLNSENEKLAAALTASREREAKLRAKNELYFWAVHNVSTKLINANFNGENLKEVVNTCIEDLSAFQRTLEEKTAQALKGGE